MEIKTIELDSHRINLTYSKFFGWKVVHPLKNEDGSINWINVLVGGKANLLTLILIMIFFAALFFGVNEITKSCRDMANNPCKYIDIDCTVFHPKPDIKQFCTNNLCFEPAPLKDINFTQ